MRSGAHSSKVTALALATAVIASSGVLVGVSAGLSTGCKSKGKAAAPLPVAGLAAVPATATVVVSIDVPRVAGSPLVQRAVEKLLLQDADLAGRWERLRLECKLDVVGAVQQVVLALGPKPPSADGGGGAPVLLVATGKLAEAELAACVRGLVGKGGGTLSAKTAEGRTLYQAKEGNRSVWFGFGRPDTVVLGSQEAFVVEALSNGKKVDTNAELRAYMDLADRKQALWAAGQVDAAIGERLLRPAAGTLKAGPRGFVVSADASSGLKASLGAVMASVEDAKALELLAKQQLSLLAMAAQVRGLGRLVAKISAVAEDKVVRIAVTLDPTEINQLLSAVDSASTGSQDAPPAEPSQPSP
jgi:hypothetical protein